MRLSHLFGFALLFLGHSVQAQPAGGVISGTVRDAGSGQPLAHANILLERAEGDRVAGTASSASGVFTIGPVPAGEYVVVVRFVGYQESKYPVEIDGAATIMLSIALERGGVELDAIVISANRAPEKLLEVPASMSVITGEELNRDAGVSIVDGLRTEPGVHVAEMGIDRREMSLRGMLGASALTDYRAHGTAIKIQAFGLMPVFRLDLDRVEVVRGPVGALYGPGYASGVVHFLSKDPFNSPGTSFSLTGGERSLMGGEFRHAGVRGRVAYKFLADYARADDWTMDPDDPIDTTAVYGELFERRSDYERRRISASAVYRSNSGNDLTASAGWSDITTNANNGVGAMYIGGWQSMFAQVRFRTERYFAQVYLNADEDGGDSYIYSVDANGDRLPDYLSDQSLSYNAQFQAKVLTTRSGRIAAGVDSEWIRPRTEGTISGRNESSDHVDIHGVYAHGSYDLHPKLQLSGALRADWFRPLKTVEWSPRIAAVYRKSPSQTFRVSWNRAFVPPDFRALYGDMSVGNIGGLPISVGAEVGGFHWARNPDYSAIAGTDLVAYSLGGPSPGAGMPVGLALEDAYAGLYGGLGTAGDLAALLRGTGISVGADLAAALHSQLAPGAWSPQGFSPGLMAFVGDNSLYPVTDLVDVPEAAPHSVHAFEAGYRGLMGKRVVFSVDAWLTNQQNLNAPLSMETPMVFVPGLAADLQAELTRALQADAGLTAQLAGLGMSASELSAVLVQAGRGHLPPENLPIAVIVPEERAPEPGALPPLVLVNRQYGRLTLWGLDVSAQWAAMDALSLWGNVSYVSDNAFDRADLGLDYDIAPVLGNFPKIKLNVGGEYRGEPGWYVGASARYRGSYPVEFGYAFEAIERALMLDLSAGLDLVRVARGLRMDMGVSNMLDQRHRQMIDIPKLGRLAFLRMTYQPQPSDD